MNIGIFTNNYLPLSKSWAIRMILLDMLYGKDTKYKIINYFSEQEKKDLADDIKAALSCAKTFISGGKVYKVYNIKNSGTVCRFIIYFLDGKKYKIVKGDQLLKRKIVAPKNISKLSLLELLKLGTTQFVSAALLKGIKPINKLPAKCKLSVKARKVYFKNKGKWVSKIDEVIIRQINHFLKGGKFKPLIAEDYCYARAFNFITQKEGKRRWPELKNHESNRLKVMEKVCQNFNRRIDVSDDHRIVMAVALRQKFLGLPMRVNNKKCVSKSWPQFWQWLNKNS